MKTTIPLFFIAIIASFFISCQDDDLLTDGNYDIQFSVDTLLFDTVFTSIGSATRSIKIINKEDTRIRLGNIQLRGGDASFFRINIDGLPVNQASDVEIAGNDSLYIFVEVTIDPDQPISNSPFVFNDYIDVETNGIKKTAVLEAWGQNANYIPNKGNAGEFYILPCDLGQVTWDDPKPYVIYGLLVVDACDLVLPAGTHIYVHGGLAYSDTDSVYFNDGNIIVSGSGSIQANGTMDQPITIEGDRLEPEFDEVSAQWTGIRILPTSQGNSFAHTTIKNSIIGIYADSASTLDLENVQLYNISNSALVGVNATINADNCLVHTVYGQGNILLTYGGDYNFNYCTVANYEAGSESYALYLSNTKCFDSFCSQCEEKDLNATFTNCIFTGSSADEVVFLNGENCNNNADFNYTFNHCILRMDDILDVPAYANFFQEQTNCINTESSDTLFVASYDWDYHLDSASIAEQKGIPVNGINMDIEGNMRAINLPDIGAYEFVD